ncbi:metalloregulator ArsR/SmtB family transcription factor [Streptococcus suis]|uniref:ArsR/SmtB family transcription factor n=1 Tax=Streptococcus suis TaxID=1307 RepID=UPI002FC5E226
MSPDVFSITKLLSDQSRMHILDILMDGAAHTVNEIASYTNLKQHTVSYHLKLMKEANLLNVQAYGKFRYYSIKDTPTIKIFEVLSNYSPERPVKSFNQHFRKKELKKARTCYDHIAGELGVAIANSFITLGFIEEEEGNNFQLTSKGQDYFCKKLDFNIELLRNKKRKFCIKCLDWSERKNHLAGSLAKEILDFLIKNKIIERMEQSRALKITDTGVNFLKNEWDISIE